MLILQRKRHESIIIGGVIKVTITAVRGDTISLGIEAPRDIEVHRKEVFDAINERLRKQDEGEI